MSKIKYQNRRNSLVFYVTLYVFKIYALFKYRVMILGTENIPDKTAFVILPKHQCFDDIPLVAWAASKPLYYVAKHELFGNCFAKWFFSALGGLPLNRKRPIESRHTLVNIINLLGKGEGIVVFPEGTYFKNRMGPGNIGIVRMILTRLSLPFVPVGITYTRKRLRTHVTISFGKPYMAEKDPKTGKLISTPEEILDTILKDIACLSGLEYKSRTNAESEHND